MDLKDILKKFLEAVLDGSIRLIKVQDEHDDYRGRKITFYYRWDEYENE